jgi:hypothetical protein
MALDEPAWLKWNNKMVNHISKAELIEAQPVRNRLRIVFQLLPY